MTNPSASHLAILSVQFHIPAAQSLKEKRRVVKSIKDKVRARFNVSVSEIGGLDKWQECILGIAMIGCDKRYMDTGLQGVLSLIEKVHDIRVLRHELVFL